MQLPLPVTPGKYEGEYVFSYKYGRPGNLKYTASHRKKIIVFLDNNGDLVEPKPVCFDLPIIEGDLK